jgi:hypothetical protein
VDPEGLLLWLLEPTTGPFSVPDDSSPRILTVFLRCTLLLNFHLCFDFPSGLFPGRSYVHISCMLHTLLIPSSLFYHANNEVPPACPFSITSLFLNITQCMFVLWCETPSCVPIHNTGNIVIVHSESLYFWTAHRMQKILNCMVADFPN